MTGQRFGSYEVLAKIGAGGMGEVYRARDTQLDRDVALKILPQLFATDPDRLARFEREAKTLAALNHPNIAHLHGIERAGDARALVMELVSGDDLSQLLARGPIPVSEALAISRQIALALEAAHASGIIHRDLKPANIKVRDDGTVKVLDFGLAKAATDASDSTAGQAATMTSPAIFDWGSGRPEQGRGPMTQAGIILGTAAYMSPEQARGRQVDKRADIWAFGCVLFEMLTGRSAFPGDNITDVLAAVVTAEPDWTALPASTPAAVRTLVKRCLQKDPKQRLHDIADARIELDGIGSEPALAGPGAGGPGGGPATQPATARGRGFNVAIIAAAILLSLAAGTFAGWTWRASKTIAPVQWSGARLGGPAFAMQPMVSPDGHLIAFIALVDRQSQVAVMKPNAASWTIITTSRTHGLVDSICWTPDGSHVLYDRITDSPQGIYAIPALGGDERLVIENAARPLALGDGSIVFERINSARMLQLHRFWPESGKIDELPVITSEVVGFRGLVRQRDATHLIVKGHAPGETQPRDTVRILDLSSGQMTPLDTGSKGLVMGLAVDQSDSSVIATIREGTVYRIVRLVPGDPARTATVMTLLQQSTVSTAPDGSLYIGLIERPVETLRFSVPDGNVERFPLSPQSFRGAAIGLEDGRAIFPGRINDAFRMLVGAPGKEPSAFVQTDEATGGPMTLVAGNRVALLAGQIGTAPEIAIVAVESGRILKRFPTGAPAQITGLGASPDGRELYYSSKGSIYAIPTDGGAARQIGAGDSLAVDPDSGDIIVKLDEQGGFKIARFPASGGASRTIQMKGDFQLVPEPLTAMSIRKGRLALVGGSPDSWYWFPAMLDLASGRLERMKVNYDTDFHYLAWTPDGHIIAAAAGMATTMWKFEKVK